MTTRSSRQPRLLTLTTATALVAGALAALAAPASAATGTFTQSTPIVAEHELNDYAEAENTTPLVVPDGGSASSSATVTAPADAVVTWVSAEVRLTHESQDDLDLVLVAPDGRAMTLASDVGGAHSIDGWVSLYGGYSTLEDDDWCSTGCYGGPTDHDTTPGDRDPYPGAAPPDFRAVGGGTRAAGTWTLHAYDDTTGNVGQVDEWEIELYYGLPADPSPSTLAVSGLPDDVTDVDLVLNDVTGDLDYSEFVLESPDGRFAHVLSDIDELDHVSFTLDDEALMPVPRWDEPVSGNSYRPRNYDDDEQTEPVAGRETEDMDAHLSVFDGGRANGTWKLWVMNDYCCTTTTVGSWSLRVTTSDLPAKPVITSPSNGTRVADGTVTLTGTGVDGAVVRTTVGGKTRSTVVEGGGWSQTVSGLATGSHAFSVTQTTKAGTSPAATVTVVGGGSTGGTGGPGGTGGVAVDTLAPTVGSTNPKDGAKRVKPSVSPKVTFSEAMQVSSLNTNVKLTGPRKKTVKAKLTWDAATKTLTVNPKKKLAGRTTYKLTVKSGVRDLAGNQLARTRTIRFTTR